MKRIICFLSLIGFIFLNSGCIPLIVGGTVGAVGAIVVSKDTIQADSDKGYDNLWNAAQAVGKMQGTIKKEDYDHGFLSYGVNSAQVTIRFIRLTRKATRLRITARKHHLPDLSLAEETFTKIMEEAQ